MWFQFYIAKSTQKFSNQIIETLYKSVFLSWYRCASLCSCIWEYNTDQSTFLSVWLFSVTYFCFIQVFLEFVFLRQVINFSYVPLYYQLSIISIISLIEVKKLWCLTSEYMSQEERQLKNLIKIIYSILH